jgi:iron complex transport system ATP-binding protein
MPAPGVLFRDVHFAYPGLRDALDGASGEAAAGEIVAVVGPNGSGKSTLLGVLAGALRPRAGLVEAGGIAPAAASPRERARVLGRLTQTEPFDAPFTVGELVLQGRYARQGASPFDRDEDRAAAAAALADVGIERLADRLPGELSGGERQRAFLARALAVEPRVLLLDEPASSLDPPGQAEIYRLLTRLRDRRGTTVVVVSHDLNLPAVAADRVFALKRGKVVAAGSPREVLRAAVLAAVYDAPFLEAAVPGRATPLVFPQA